MIEGVSSSRLQKDLMMNIREVGITDNGFAKQYRFFIWCETRNMPQLSSSAFYDKKIT